MSSLLKSLPLVALGLGLGLGLAWILRAPAPADSSAPRSEAPFADATPASRYPDLALAPTNPSDSDKQRSAASANALSDSSDADSLADASETSPAGLPPEERERLLEQITDTYTTYEPGALPKLAPFLRHADAEVRAYARDAIVQVGHADGAALLREAAKSARDPRESIALLDAAEFLELPPAAPVSGTFTETARPGGRRTASL